jgi:hypothetical protein
LSELASISSEGDKTFISASMSFKARRLYLFAGVSKSFPFETYRRDLEPWLVKDGQENANAEAPREGAGCWHPVFPARSDDVWLWGSIVVKAITGAIENPAKCQLRVFEQTLDAIDAVKEVTAVE